MRWLFHCIFLLSFGVLSESFCGSPGAYVGQNVSKGVDTDGDWVEYSCVGAENSEVLVGNPKRRCLNDLWTGYIPVCATQILVNHVVETINNTVVQIKMESAIEIRGFHVNTNVHSFNSSAKCLKFGNETFCTWETLTSIGGLSFEILNESEASNSLKVRFFSSVNDECGQPDTPMNGHLEIHDSCQNSEKCRKYELKCSVGYELFPKKYNLSCRSQGEKVPQCTPKKLCPKFPSRPEFVLTYYNSFNQTHMWPNGIVFYHCADNAALTGDAGRYCSNDGSWTGVEPTCDTGSIVHIPNLTVLWLILSIIAFTMFIIIVLIVIIHKRNRRIAQLQRIGSLRSRTFSYEDGQSKMKLSYKCGTTVDDNIRVNSSDFLPVKYNGNSLFYDFNTGSDRERLSLPADSGVVENYELSNHLSPSIVITEAYHMSPNSF